MNNNDLISISAWVKVMMGCNPAFPWVNRVLILPLLFVWVMVARATDHIAAPVVFYNHGSSINNSTRWVIHGTVLFFLCTKPPFMHVWSPENMKTLFFISQLSFGVHIASSFILLFITRQTPIAEELFAQSNEYLGNVGWAPRVLKAIYFIPWRAAPNEMQLQNLSVRVLFWVSRVTGACIFISILGFFVGVFIVAGGYA